MKKEAVLAFEAALELHGPLVLRICRRILGDAHAGDDAAQEAFVRLWHSYRGGKPPDNVGAWLRRVAASSSIDVLRRAHVRSFGIGLAFDAPEEVPAVRETAVVGPLAARELSAALRRAVDSLSPAQRTTFVLRHDAGFPLAEVARLLDVGLATAKTHYVRATLRLRSQLAAFEPETRR
jgi:RNA polymerase sigma-70 factor (ECF subfamily)